MASTHHTVISFLGGSFLVVAVTGVLLILTSPAVCWAAVGNGDQSGAAEVAGALCTFKQHDVQLECGDAVNVSLLVIGAHDDITLSFAYKSDKETHNDILENLPDLTLTPGSDNLTIPLTLISEGVAGHTTLVVNATPPNMTDVSDAYVRVDVAHSRGLDYLSDVVGWMYFIAWSISFYPQTYSNWRRRSVIGFHFDFLMLNTVGFTLYSIFNLGLYCSPVIQAQYFARHGPFSINPVQINDVIFGVHAVAACLIQVAQCCIYERGDQQVSKTAKGIVGAVGVLSLVMAVVSAAAVLQWLDFLYYLSYVKLFITLIKYIPQAYYNYRRKSTSGWSIGNILLDFTGGILSVTQMFILAYNYNDWGSIFGDLTKFGLGIFSIFFDIFFMIQHYVLYRTNKDATGYHDNLIPASPQLTNSSSLTESVSSVDYGSTGNTH